jgi:hypothetical protein
MVQVYAAQRFLIANRSAVSQLFIGFTPQYHYLKWGYVIRD